jgi:hypothetical protein
MSGLEQLGVASFVAMVLILGAAIYANRPR